MKSLSKLLLGLLLCLTTAVSYSQVNSKPKLFAGHPETIDLPETFFQDALTASRNQQVSIVITPGFIFNGQVISNEMKYSNLQTMVIKSPDFDNALLLLSKITNADNSYYYSGRILNERAFDGYELKKGTNGYQFQKFETGKILQDCNY